MANNQDKARRDYLAALSISDKTVRMDVEPDSPNVSHRTLMYEGRVVKINAGKNVEVSETFASILGNAAQPFRTEQMQQASAIPVIDLL